MSKKAEQMIKEGFTQDQIFEIEEGLKAGLDVSVYAKKEFLAIQMRQIRYGMQQKLSVMKYARPDFDWFQMEEIRKGLAEGLDVDLYAFPEITYDRMQQIRLGLSVGIDFTPYRRMDAGILRELRLAMQSRINIVPYINAGYDKEQLEAIREALEKQLDISSFLSKEFRGISIKEICIGLEDGLDISIYAKPEYCWQQMREIRLGLEHMVDVEKYSSLFYSWQQMREIRLGLEEGLDISYYRSFVYTADEMRERRLALKENPAIAVAEEEAFPEEDAASESELSAHYLIHISLNEMEAYLEAHGDVAEFSRADILKALRHYGIIYGIRYEEIDNIVNGNSFSKPVLIAKGKSPEDGKDGWYEFFFRTSVARTPKELEDGNVDFRSVEWFETVERGQKLAYYHGASAGEPGFSVKGKSIPARNGRELCILTGNGFKRLPDNKTYISVMKGIVTIHDFHLEISNLLVMDEVNLTTGDVDFDGNVFIQGNVSSGTKIKATGDLVVKGFVESSEIECGGSVVLRQGMNASGAGFIHAVKDVVGHFFEAVEIHSGENIHGDYFLNCKMHAEGKVCVTGKKGTLAGGSVFAEKGLKAYNLGNQVGLATYVKLGIGERIARKLLELEDTVRSVNGELYILANAHREFQIKYPAEVRNTMDIYLKIESALYTKEKELEELLQTRSCLEEERKTAEQISAVVEEQLYDGVFFEIDGARWRSKSVKGVLIKKKEGRIAVFSY